MLWFKKKPVIEPEPILEPEVPNKYSIEKLYHFRCGDCNRWWTVADWHLSRDDHITCPFCENYGPAERLIAEVPGAE